MYCIEDIPIGAENAITRQELARKWHVDDRSARRYIEKLRAQDNGDRFVIVSHSTGKGYYRTDNLDQIMHFRNETVKRMRNTSLPLNKINRILGGCADQTVMEVTL